MIVSTDYYLDPDLHCHICSTLTFILPHIYNTALGMLQDQAGDVGKAQWNNIEIAKLVDYLYEHCAQGGDTGNFRDTVYNSAAEYIWPFHTMGPIKTGKMVKNKWTWVSQISVDPPRSTLILVQYCIDQRDLQYD